MARWPKFKDQYLRTIAKMLDARKESGLSCEGHYSSPEECFRWWIESTDALEAQEEK